MPRRNTLYLWSHFQWTITKLSQYIFGRESWSNVKSLTDIVVASICFWCVFLHCCRTPSTFTMEIIVFCCVTITHMHSGVWAPNLHICYYALKYLGVFSSWFYELLLIKHFFTSPKLTSHCQKLYLETELLPTLILLSNVCQCRRSIHKKKNLEENTLGKCSASLCLYGKTTRQGQKKLWLCMFYQSFLLSFSSLAT